MIKTSSRIRQNKIEDKTTEKRVMKSRKIIVNYKKLFFLIFIFLLILFTSFKTIFFLKDKFFPIEKQETLIKNKVEKLVIIKDKEVKVYKIQHTVELIEKSEFYKDIESGDFVLVYPNSQKILIYREKENIIVNYSPTLNI